MNMVVAPPARMRSGLAPNHFILLSYFLRNIG